MNTTRILHRLVPAIAVALAASTASAQSLPAFNLERLTLDPAAHGSLVVGDGEVGPAGALRLSAAGGYERQPLVLMPDGRLRGHGIDAPAHSADVVGYRFTLFTGLAYAITDSLEVHAQIPVILSQGGDGLPGASALKSGGLGAPSAGLKLALLSQDGGILPINLALAGDVILNWGVKEGFGSDDGVDFAPRLELGHRFDGWLIAAQLGGLLRTNDVVYTDAGGPHALKSELTGGLAVATTGALRYELSGHGRWNFDGLGDSYEVLAGLRWNIGPAELFALAGPGFGQSPGTPLYRGLLGIALDLGGEKPAAKAAPAPVAPPPPPPPDPCAAGQQHTPEQCPNLDDDGDGVPNGQDACPLVKGVPELKGCPDKDTDGDGIPDRLDKCPNEPGTAEYQGCPPPKSAVLEKSATGPAKIAIKEAVYFDTGKATIQQRSFSVLDDVAAVLKAHPEIAKVVVEGHTDSAGSKKKNQALSQARAAAVRDYLIGKGIAADRIEAKGFGPSRPVADNKTAAGREKNRRVEFVVP